MTVYVDFPVNYHFAPNDRRNGLWCHLWTDGDVEELHAFADRLGVRRDWLHVSPSAFLGRDFEHYDLRPAKRAEALRLGAQAIRLTDYLRPFVERQRQAKGQTP